MLHVYLGLRSMYVNDFHIKRFKLLKNDNLPPNIAMSPLIDIKILCRTCFRAIAEFLSLLAFLFFCTNFFLSPGSCALACLLFCLRFPTTQHNTHNRIRFWLSIVKKSAVRKSVESLATQLCCGVCNFCFCSNKNRYFTHIMFRTHFCLASYFY